MVSEANSVTNVLCCICVVALATLLTFIFCIHAEPVKPVIEVPKPGRDIPVGDGSPVTMNIGDNVTSASNTTITIRCPVSGVPTPAVTWEKDSVLVLNDDDRFSVRKDNSLVITGADENTEYTCKVSNVAGKDSLTSIINVIGQYSKAPVY